MIVNDHYNHSLSNWHHPLCYRRSNVQRGGMWPGSSMRSEELEDINKNQGLPLTPYVHNMFPASIGSSAVSTEESYPNPKIGFEDKLKGFLESIDPRSASNKKYWLPWLSNNLENLPHITKTDQFFLETWTYWGSMLQLPRCFISIVKVVFVLWKYKTTEIRELFVAFVNFLYTIPLFKPIALIIMTTSDVVHSVPHEFLMINLIVIGCIMALDWEMNRPFRSFLTAFHRWFMIYVNIAKKLHYAVSNIEEAMQKIQQLWKKAEYFEPMPVDLYEGMYEEGAEANEAEKEATEEFLENYSAQPFEFSSEQHIKEPIERVVMRIASALKSGATSLATKLCPQPEGNFIEELGEARTAKQQKEDEEYEAEKRRIVEQEEDDEEYEAEKRRILEED